MASKTNALKKKGSELERINRLYAASSQINQCLIHATSREELFAEVCRVLIETGRFEMAWIGWVNKETHAVGIAAQHGDHNGYLKEIPIYTDDRPEGRGPTGICIRENRAYICNDFTTDPAIVPWRGKASLSGFVSSISVPIRFQGETAGALMAYSSEKHFFGEEEVRLMQEAVQDISFGLDHLDQERQRDEAEAALKERENRFEQLARHTRTFAWEVNADGLYTYVHHVVEQVLGYRPEELVGTSYFYDLHPEEGREAFKAAAFEVFARKEHFFNLLNPAQTKDGQTVWLATNGIPQLNADGTLRGYCGSDTDVTQRKKTEAALLESEFFFKESQRAASIGSYKANFVKDYWESSEVLDQIFGIDQTYERSVKGWLDIVHPEDREMMTRYLQDEILSGRTGFNKEYRIVRQSDGETRWVLGMGQIDFDAAGHVISLIGVIQDITKRRKAEEANQRLMVAIDQAAESIVFTDLNGVILYVNQGFEKLTGYTREEALGRYPRILSSGRQSQAYYKEMWETITRGEVWHGRFSNKRKDGTIFEEEATISPVRNSEGKTTSYVAVKRDITREVLLERQVVEAQKMEAVGLLAGGLAHDYNNILAANMLQLGIILDNPGLPPDLREALESLQEGEERGAQLTRQLLMFSRRQVIQKRPVELFALLKEELKMIRRLLGEQIELILQSRCGPAWIEADSGMIEQVIMNFCINARDAMAHGGQLSVNIQFAELDDSVPLTSLDARRGKFVCLSVADNGCGMSPETQQQIFEPFFTTKEVGKGTGLGLATAYGIIKQHNGWIEVTSEPGKGSEFRVYLPTIAPPLPSPNPVIAAARMSRGTENILVVEDDPNVQKAIVACLKTKGYCVFAASGGPEALRAWRDRLSEIDLLLTDMIMPGGMTGLEMAEAFQKIDPSLPVIIMSGYSHEIAQTGVPIRPGHTFLSKPCDLLELTTAVRRALDQASNCS